MGKLIYKRDYSFFFAIRTSHHVNYLESLWGEINTKRDIRKHRLGNTDWDWNIHSWMISHISRLVSYHDLYMLNLWFFLRCFSQIKFIPNDYKP